MEIVWKSNKEDIEKLRKFYEENKDNILVRNRIDRNIKKNYNRISKSIFFKAMIKFINAKPFPIRYELCKEQNDLKNYILTILNYHKGIRRKNKITDEIITNFRLLEKNLWKKLFEILEPLASKDSMVEERKTADFIMNNFKGFGPKQSRNLLQSLGLTKYEIPIDSRITKWLEKFGFPIKLSAAALGDINYYNFISDGFQRLCKESGIKPCIMDAAIFSSYDNGWTEQNIVW